MPNLRRSLDGVNDAAQETAPGSYPLSWPGNRKLVLTPHITREMSYDSPLSCCNSTEGLVYLVQVSELGLLDLEGTLDNSIPEALISE